MPTTLSSADAALKEDYLPGIRSTLNDAFPFLNQIEKNSIDTEGRRAVLSLNTGHNQGVGPRAEGGTLPDAGQESYAEERVPLRYNYGRMQISGPVIAAMKSDKGSFVRAVDSASKGTITSLKKEVNHQLFNDGTGRIATCGVTTASATLVLAAATTDTEMRAFYVNMKVDIGTLAAPTGAASGVTVTAVQFAARTLTLSSAVTTAATDFVFRQGAGGTGATQKALTGVKAIISDTGTLFNVDPAVNPSWKSTVLANGGTPRAATETLFAKFMDEVAIASGMGVGNLMISNFGVARNYAAPLTSQKRFNDTVELSGGWSGLKINGSSGSTTLVPDKDCTEGLAYSINTEHMFQHESSDWDFMDQDGAILSRVPNVHAYEATLFKIHELTTDHRAAHGVLKDLSQS